MSEPVKPIGPEGGARGPRGVEAPGKKFAEKMIEAVEKIGESEFEKKHARQKAEPGPANAPFEAPIGFKDLESNAIPTPKNALPPQNEMAPPPPENIAPPLTEALPESEEFWEDMTLPDSPPAINLVEEPSSEKKESAETKKEKAAAFLSKKAPKEPARAVPVKGKIAKMPAEKEKKAEAEPSLAPGKKEAKEKRAAFLPPKSQAEARVKKEEKAPPQPSPWQPPATATEKPKAPAPREQLEEARAPAPIEELPTTQKKTKRISLPAEMAKKEKALAKEAPAKGAAKKEEKKRAPEEMEKIPVRPPDPLPPACINIAQVAQTYASPFLNPETAQLFFHMVGTMAFMASATPGVSITEVVLNSPSFESSKFFNTTITIEKFATAPDSFNIRLTGSQEAVEMFQDNIESLSNAFTTAYIDNRIPFRIGRLEASFAPERPLIRRKEEGRGKGDLSRGKDGE